jgi:hypothetical protein
MRVSCLVSERLVLLLHKVCVGSGNWGQDVSVVARWIAASEGETVAEEVIFVDNAKLFEVHVGSLILERVKVH